MTLWLLVFAVGVIVGGILQNLLNKPPVVYMGIEKPQDNDEPKVRQIKSKPSRKQLKKK